jgi:hypothetical protein
VRTEASEISQHYSQNEKTSAAHDDVGKIPVIELLGVNDNKQKEHGGALT